MCPRGGVGFGNIVGVIVVALTFLQLAEIKGNIDDKADNNNKEKDPSFLDLNIDKHAIFSLPLSQGAYDFDVDGFLRKSSYQMEWTVKF